jgi:hypothetical protein
MIKALYTCMKTEKMKPIANCCKWGTGDKKIIIGVILIKVHYMHVRKHDSETPLCN